MEADDEKSVVQQPLKPPSSFARSAKSLGHRLKVAIEFLGTHPFATGFLALLSLFGVAFSLFQYYEAAADSQESRSQASRIEKKLDDAGREVSPEFLANFRSLVSAECTKNKAQLHDMMEEARAGRRSGNFNAYRVPDFSETITLQFARHPALMNTTDPDMLKVLKALGSLDYKHVFSQRDADGTMFGGFVSDYIIDMHILCDWVDIDLGYRDQFERYR